MNTSATSDSGHAAAGVHDTRPASGHADAAADDAQAAAVIVRFDVPGDHAAFEGHFPGAPLLPGVVLLAEVMEALRAAPALAGRLGPRPAIAAAKFLAPVCPGDSLSIVLRAAGAGAAAFEVRRDADLTTVASGRLVRDVPAGATAAS
jgi:3-hydroxyacyl-[acyl-carrier-protein] dehydratase